MKLPGLDAPPSLAPAVEELLDQAGTRETEPLSTRERRVHASAAVALVGACVALAAVHRGIGAEVGPAIVLTVAYAVAARVRFYVGAGFTMPTELVLVPLLFLATPGLVPLLVAAGSLLSLLVDVLARRMHPDRLLLAAPAAWHSLGPALVFAAAGIDHPAWGDAPIYLGALAAQFALDAVAGVAGEWLAHGVPPRLQVAVVSRVYLVDALLAPVGLLAAFAAVGAPYRALVVLPLVIVFAAFAQERRANLQNALELSNAYRGTALLLGDVLEDKDAYTASHSHGVVSLSLLVADRLGLSPAARRRVEFGALLHDIGKIAVPAEILNKAGPLDEEEWVVMKLHTVVGQQMLDRVGGVLGEVGLVVRASHEHWDGSGYPDRLAGEAIPIEARIVCACDAFSAMTTDRSYRPAMSLEAASAELESSAGTQFDPRVVEVLLQVVEAPSGFGSGAGGPAPQAVA